VLQPFLAQIPLQEETKPAMPKKLSSSFYYPPFGVTGEKEDASTDVGTLLKSSH
jgi:hypothetical protein